MANEYSKFFNKDMTYREAQSQFFKISRRLSGKEDMDALYEAYKEVAGETIKKEIDDSFKKGYFA